MDVVARIPQASSDKGGEGRFKRYETGGRRDLYGKGFVYDRIGIGDQCSMEDGSASDGCDGRDCGQDI